jgi:hypothetical protein
MSVEKGKAVSAFRKAVLATVSLSLIAGGVGKVMQGVENAQSAQSVEMGMTLDAVQTLADYASPETSPFLVLSDTNHGDMKILEFMAQPPAMEALAAKGYKNIFLEERVEFQGIADLVASGHITPQQYADVKADMYAEAGDTAGAVPSQRSVMVGTIIQTAAQSGLKVILAEGQAPDLSAHARMVDNINQAQDRFTSQLQSDAAAIGGLSAIASKFYKGDVQNVRLQYSAISKDISTDWSAHSTWRGTIAERIDGDARLAEKIIEQSAGEASVVFYGAAHGRHGHDLDEHLGAQRLELFSDGLSARISWEQSHALGEQPADALIIKSGTLIDKGTIAKFTAGAAQTNPLNRVDAVLTAPKKNIF